AAPPNSGPSYYMPAQLACHGTPLVNPNESTWSRFPRMQVFTQDKLSGNMNIVTGVELFIGGIIYRTLFGRIL
ncbi:hypothetical protein EI94DRAFT_1488050, partial [Lactarius quietus]